ncbi:hypothetical protein [Marinomonas posidonica]|uniref:hypothetical protein n=1 Tax=Marinomonas posidonica TaxID=936476 RepID=UPI003735088B
MSNKFISNWFYSSLGKYDVEKGIFKKTTEQHHSQRYVDFDEFSEQLRKMYEDYDSEGYDVVNVIPIQMGQSEQSIAKTKELISQSNYLGDVGFSITRGAVVIGKRRD